MKQNLFEAKRGTSIAVGFIIVLLVCDAGCVKQERKYALDANPGTTTAKTDTTRVNINTATADELQRLPGIGKVIAERIVEHRLQHGPFRRVEHLMMVRGISERKFRAIEASINVQRTP